MAAMSIDAATDSAVFATYLDEVLLPTLRQDKPDAVLVMDNLRAHKTPAVQAVLDRSGFAYPKFGSCVIAAVSRIGRICGHGNARTSHHHSPGG